MINLSHLARMGRTYRHLNRYQEIIGILVKYGFGELIDRLRPESLLPVNLNILRRHGPAGRIAKLTRPQRLRLALEELGPTFIKLAQMLSTRPDLIPMEYNREFAKLQDQVPPFPFKHAAGIIREELGSELDSLFNEFQEEPVAAASLGQVHCASLKDGTAVVVKVQRPNIRQTVEADLEILYYLAQLAERHFQEAHHYHPAAVVLEFSRTLRKELHYDNEATHIDLFRRYFLKDNTVAVPRVFRHLSTSRVLTMERLSGIKPDDVDTLRNRGHHLQSIAQRGSRAILKQIFELGFFHADPHPGNLFILPGDVIGYMDFGMMGRLIKREREELADMALYIVQGDTRKMVGALLRLTKHEKEIDRSILERDLAELIDIYSHIPLRHLDLAQLWQQVRQTLKDHRISLKPQFYLMLKALGTSEGIGRRLDPDFNLMDHIKPFVRDIQLKRLNPYHAAAELFSGSHEALRFLSDFPDTLTSFIRQFREGRTAIRFEHRGLEPLMETLDLVSSRITFAIVLAALVIGSSLIVLSGLPPLWHRIPIIGLGGFVLAGIIGFLLLISIIRKRRF